MHAVSLNLASLPAVLSLRKGQAMVVEIDPQIQWKEKEQ
jgi:hypothetical protein